MKTITLRVSDSVAAEISQEAKRRRLTKSDVLRERITQTGGGSAPAAGRTLADVMPDLWAEINAEAPSRVGTARSLSPHKARVAAAIRAKKLHRR